MGVVSLLEVASLSEGAVLEELVPLLGVGPPLEVVSLLLVVPLVGYTTDTLVVSLSKAEAG